MVSASPTLDNQQICCTFMEINVAKNDQVLLNELVMAITMMRHQM